MFKTNKKLYALFLGVSILTFSLGFTSIAEATASTLSIQFKNLIILFNGQQVTLDAQPLIVNGSTYLPVRALSTLFNKNIGWNSTTQTIAIVDNANSNVTSNNNDLETTKLYSKIAHHYKMLGDLGDMTTKYSNGLSIAYDYMELYNDVSILNTRIDDFNSLTESYNNYINISEHIISLAKQNNIDISDSRMILNKYKMAYSDYRNAIESLIDYADSGYSQESYAKSYLDYDGKAFDSALEGKKLAAQGYTKYYQKTQE